MRRPAVLVVTLLLALAADVGLAGCVGLPHAGPVHARTIPDSGEGETLVDYTPSGPRAGSTPRPLVEDFLTAMRATPMTTLVARQYLTAAARPRWAPQRGTVVYGSQQLVPGPRGQMVLRLRDVMELDARGGWLGDPTRGHGHDYTLHLVKEGGEWRISDPPNRLVVPRTHFDSLYQQYFLYFFDPTGQVLVPEPVYVPRGSQASTLLITGLLQGPPGARPGVERSYLPARAALDGISVPVSLAGTAEVPLTAQVLDIPDADLERSFAQIAWTLGQLSAVERVRITVDGTPVDPPGESATSLDVADASSYDPSLAWASSALFGVRDRHVVTRLVDREERVSGAFGALPLDPRSIAVDGLAQHVGGVSADGTRLLVADRDKTPHRAAQASDARVVLRGTDLLQPVYDLHDQLWVLDRTSSGARLSVVRGSTVRAWSAPGLTGADVRRLLVSRDGTRLVAQRRRDGHDELVMARVERDESGRLLGIGAAHRLLLEGAPDRILDIAWRTPGELAVLVSPSPGSSEVLFAKIDGSSTASELSMDAALFHGRVARLVTSPSRGAPLSLSTSAGQLYTLSGRGRWSTGKVPAGLLTATYVD